MNDPDERAKAYARGETLRVGVELAAGGPRSDEAYRLIFERLLESAFRIGYAAGADDELRQQVYNRRERKGR